MYIRRVKSRNSTCFQIGKKQSGRFSVIEHIGCTQKESEVEALHQKAKQRMWELNFENQLFLFSQKSPFKAKLIGWYVTGYHLVFGTVYDRIGFPNNLLRDLVIARIVYPRSKIATVRFLNNTLGISLAKDQVYRFMDTLDKDTITDTAYRYVSSRQEDKRLSLAFYDVTTLYFESDKEDDLRQKGFSKDHRHDMPQILIGLCVDQDGYPFDLEYFEGKMFEGHTLPLVIDTLQKKHRFSQLTVVADAGMLSRDNLTYLNEQGIGYIVGARLKNLPEKVKKQVISHNYQVNGIYESTYQESMLLIDYSAKRAKKDEINRERIIRSLEKRLEKQQAVIRKSKYLRTSGSNQIEGIDQEKVQEDAAYDGLKGYVTNARSYLSCQDVTKHYRDLWHVEKAFRMSKTDLKQRPVYHSKPERIKAHLLLCFVSLLVMKEAEHILKSKGYSLDTAIECLGRVGEGQVRVGNVTLELENNIDHDTQSLINLFQGH